MNLSKLSSLFYLVCLSLPPLALTARAQSSHDPEPAGSTPKPALPSLPPLAPHPVIALTFDDLPAAADLPPGDTRTEVLTRLAAELNASHLKGTYGFVNALKLENNPDAQQALHVWVDAGMNIGSHTWSHMSLTANSAEAFEQNIAQNEPALVQYAHGRDWHWFRYPFLWEGDTVEKRHAVRTYLHEHGYRVAQVSLDFEDYAWNDAYARCSAKHDSASFDWLKQSYLDTAVEYIRLGRQEQQIAFGREIPNVMLLHATAFTTLMLPRLLDLLGTQGFRFASLQEVEKDPAYALDPDAGLKFGGTLPDQFMDSRHLPYPPVKPKPFAQLKDLCRYITLPRLVRLAALSPHPASGESGESMKSDRLVIAAVIFLAAGLALLFGFTNGTTGLSVGYPFSETKMHVDLTTTGIPTLVGIPLLGAGTLLLLFALIAAVASQFQRPPEPPLALNLPTRRSEPFAEFHEAHPQRPGEFE